MKLKEGIKAMTVEQILNMLESTPHINVSTDLIKEVGLNSAIVYSELKEKYDQNNQQGFICTIEDLEYECNVSKAQQKQILDSLQEKGYIKVNYKGIPRHRYIEFVK